MRRFVFIATLILAVGVAFYFWPAAHEPSPRKGIDSSADKAKPKIADATTNAPTSGTRGAAGTSSATDAARPIFVRDVAVPPPWNEADFPIAAPLNASTGTIARDLDIVRQLFDAWQSNFPREGNPVGENADITAALMGDNRLQLKLIPKGHPAINENGELCDRWGTPFRFHQISGTQMEIRSAGPDRKFATEDDALWGAP
jgi:hypothetical protein